MYFLYKIFVFYTSKEENIFRIEDFRPCYEYAELLSCGYKIVVKFVNLYKKKYCFFQK